MSSPPSVADALAALGATRTAVTLIPLDVEHMLTHEPPPVEWLIDGVAARGHFTLLAGREKQGKSLLALGVIAAAVSDGGTVAGIECRSCRALVVDAENGEREIHRRVRKLGLSTESAQRLAFRCAAGFDLRKGLAELEAAIDQATPDLVVLDSFRSLWGGDENDNAQAAAVLDPLRRLAHDRNIAIILVHHLPKHGGSFRGATAIGASAEHLLTLERLTSDPRRNRRRLSNDAGCRFDAEAPDRWLTIQADEALGFLFIDEAEPYESHDSLAEPARAKTRMRIADQLGELLTTEPQTTAALARSLERNPKDQTVRRALDALAAAGQAVRTDDGWVSGCQGVNPVGDVTLDTPGVSGSDGRVEHDPLCSYPALHAGSSWRTQDRRLVCGECHPPARLSLVAGWAL